MFSKKQNAFEHLTFNKPRDKNSKQNLNKKSLTPIFVTLS